VKYFWTSELKKSVVINRKASASPEYIVNAGLLSDERIHQRCLIVCERCLAEIAQSAKH